MTLSEGQSLPIEAARLARAEAHIAEITARMTRQLTPSPLNPADKALGTIIHHAAEMGYEPEVLLGDEESRRLTEQIVVYELGLRVDTTEAQRAAWRIGWYTVDRSRQHHQIT